MQGWWRSESGNIWNIIFTRNNCPMCQNHSTLLKEKKRWPSADPTICFTKPIHTTPTTSITVTHFFNLPICFVYLRSFLPVSTSNFNFSFRSIGVPSPKFTLLYNITHMFWFIYGHFFSSSFWFPFFFRSCWGTGQDPRNKRQPTAWHEEAWDIKGRRQGINMSLFLNEGGGCNDTSGRRRE